MVELKKATDIKKYLGKAGKQFAKEWFDKNYRYQFGDDFNSLVRNSVQVGLSKTRPGSEVCIAQKLNGNTADSLAHWFSP